MRKIFLFAVLLASGCGTLTPAFAQTVVSPPGGTTVVGAPTGTGTGPQGAPGNPGANGATWYSASGVPSNGADLVGDFYLNSLNGDYYQKTGTSAWTLIGNLKGADGAAGVVGSTWYVAAGVPSNGADLVGDFYLNSTTADVYQKTGVATWTLQANIKGATGATGPTGPTGATGASGSGTLTNPVAGASAEYPMTNGAGTSVSDISGNSATATFGTSTAAPTWYTYGVAFYDTGTQRSPDEYIVTPLTTWKTAIITFCTPNLPMTSATTNGSGPANRLPSLVAPLAGGSAGVGFVTQPGPNLGSYFSIMPSLYLYATSANPTLATGVYAECHTYGTTLDTLDHFFVDGIEVANYSQQGTSAASVTLGTGTYYLGQGMRGVMAYATFYSTPRTATEVQSISSFQNQVVAKRPTWPHYPYMNNARTPQAIYVGDSLSATYLSQTPGTTWESTTVTDTAYTIDNWAYTSTVAMDMCTMTDQRWVSSIVPGQSTVHLWGGSNDGLHVSAADTWASIARCVPVAHKYGARIAVATMISRVNEDTFKNALNTLIRTNCPLIGCDYVEDYAEVPALGADHAYSTGVCFQDTVHLTGPGAGTCATINGTALSGYGVIAAVDSNVSNTMDGSSQSNPNTTASNAYVEAYANNYIVQTPTAAATHQLVDLAGQTSPRTIVNGSSAFSITVSTSSSQTITGVAVIPPLATGVFTPTLVSAAAGGAYWVSQISRGIVRGPAPSLTSTATPSINTDTYNLLILTAQATAITGLTITGNPTDGRIFELDVKDNGSAQAITLGSAVVASGTVPLPTTTVAGVKLHMIFSYDSSISKYVLLGVS